MKIKRKLEYHSDTYVKGFHIWCMLIVFRCVKENWVEYSISNNAGPKQRKLLRYILSWGNTLSCLGYWLKKDTYIFFFLAHVSVVKIWIWIFLTYNLLISFLKITLKGCQIFEFIFFSQTIQTNLRLIFLSNLRFW